MPFLNDEKEYTRNPLMEGFTEGHFETKDGVKLRYLHKGEGMPFIMLHGYGDDSDCWMLNAPEFAKEYDVYCIDLRGNGWSVAHHGARISRLSADVHEFVEALGCEKFNLIGHSMGCSVCWSYIDLFGQDKINKVIFFDEPPMLVSSPHFTQEEVMKTSSNPMDPYLLPHAVEKYGTGWYTGSPFFDAFSSCFRRCTKEYTNDEAFLEWAKKLPNDFLEQIAKRPPVNEEVPQKFMADLLLNHLMMDWCDLFPTIKCPVLFISGDISHATTIEQGEWFKEMMPQMEWVRFSGEEGGLHEMMQYGYKKFNKVVSEFLAE